MTEQHQKVGVVLFFKLKCGFLFGTTQPYGGADRQTGTFDVHIT